MMKTHSIFISICMMLCLFLCSGCGSNTPPPVDPQVVAAKAEQEKRETIESYKRKLHDLYYCAAEDVDDASVKDVKYDWMNLDVGIKEKIAAIQKEAHGQWSQKQYAMYMKRMTEESRKLAYYIIRTKEHKGMDSEDKWKKQLDAKQKTVDKLETKIVALGFTLDMDKVMQSATEKEQGIHTQRELKRGEFKEGPGGFGP